MRGGSDGTAATPSGVDKWVVADAECGAVMDMRYRELGAGEPKRHDRLQSQRGKGMRVHTGVDRSAGPD